MEKAMRWSYKSVHFSLKKEGLLGSSFLDENEVEISLNEYGRLGWELVSFMEVNDGLIAIFKQPFAKGLVVLHEDADEVQSVEVPQEQKGADVLPSPSPEVPVAVPDQRSSDDETDVGSIRIF